MSVVDPKPRELSNGLRPRVAVAVSWALFRPKFFSFFFGGGKAGFGGSEVGFGVWILKLWSFFLEVLSVRKLWLSDGVSLSDLIRKLLLVRRGFGGAFASVKVLKAWLVSSSVWCVVCWLGSTSVVLPSEVLVLRKFLNTKLDLLDPENGSSAGSIFCY